MFLKFEKFLRCKKNLKGTERKPQKNIVQ